MSEQRQLMRETLRAYAGRELKKIIEHENGRGPGAEKQSAVMVEGMAVLVTPPSGIPRKGWITPDDRILDVDENLHSAVRYWQRAWARQGAAAEVHRGELEGGG